MSTIEKYNKLNLPKELTIKNLSYRDVNLIYLLLKDHYIEDINKITRIYYTKEFLFWYLKKINKNHIIGLFYNNKLIGMISALIININIIDQIHNIPYINLICMQKSIRNMGILNYLVNEIKKNLCKDFNIAFFKENKISNLTFITLETFVIPINYEKLFQIGFMTEFPDKPILNSTYELHLAKITEISFITSKLNSFLEKYKIYPSVEKHFIIPKKNIVYPFVIRNKNGEITDFIVVYKSLLQCTDTNNIISVANLGFYFYESISLTLLIELLINKLKNYDFDQLSFQNIMDNDTINLTKFSTCDNTYYSIFNKNFPQIYPCNFSFFPF